MGGLLFRETALHEQLVQARRDQSDVDRRIDAICGVHIAISACFGVVLKYLPREIYKLQDVSAREELRAAQHRSEQVIIHP